MKRQLVTLFILLMLVFSSSSLFFNAVPATKATYVEGPITQDTVWTLVDSPFVLSDNVVVNPGVTLTLESGVDVRFGPEFSLMVFGRLLAQGTPERSIRFTSNKLIGSEGDWGTILFLGPEQSSLKNCIVEFGTSGITVEAGEVIVQDSVVKSCSGNGTTVKSGIIAIRNCEIASNTVNGISISGGSQVIVQNNVINANGHGVLLTGNLIGTINVEDNLIHSNTQAGIVLASDAHDNAVIVRNNVSSNNAGFLVSTETSTFITRNYISNNTVGILYEKGNGHQAHFNDIYENELGMDIAANVTVDATRNYWGHRTGPKHESLNPRGRGNPVGGKGVDLDFVFFLSLPIDHSNMSPTAVLWADKMLVAPNQMVTFIGTDSQDEGRVDQYFFDFGDGKSTDWITLSLFNHSYPATGTYVARLWLKDDFDVINENVATTTIDVQDLVPLNVQTTFNNSIVNSNEDVSVSVYVWNELGPVENANIMLFSIKGGSFSSASGLTDSSGYFTSTFRAGNVSEPTDVRIIARASMDGYADGADHSYLQILPLLRVYVTSESTRLKSEETEAITVQVTDTFEQPVSDVAVAMSSDNGTLSADSGITDENGTLTFNFTASQTLGEIRVVITVLASKKDYSEGLALLELVIEPKQLVLELEPESTIVVSETTTIIAAHVTYDSAPIPNATITGSSDVGGNFTIPEPTDSDGNATIIFTAPRTTEHEGIVATIAIMASKEGYVSGETQTSIQIIPKIITVQIFAEPNVTISDGQVNITVHAEYEDKSLAGANVTLATQEGQLASTTELTDQYGNAAFLFTAPRINEQVNVTITAVTAMDGYIENTSTYFLAVNPRTFTFQITAPPPKRGEPATVTVQVTCREDGTTVEAATVNLLLDRGELMTNVTDSTGICTFALSSSHTTALNINMTFTFAKYGYVESRSTITVPVIQPEAGFPLLMVLLILIPVVIAVAIAILIRLKIIVISSEDEE